VIVRIATEDQFDVPQEHVEELNRLDNEVVDAVQAKDEARYTETFARLVELVRSRGTVLGDDDLRESEVILPPPDTGIEEAARDFSGEGVIPESFMPGSA
jgi:hypothetical protein